ncbi:hypothetical protein H9Q13_06125 [Pontibacter sp. JH31]|uniref:PH domain-containing protein n=1 Tax=Pontibacter aquaedesilientis TaxID=2766980 RepID=A0ABR7XEL5_9BACT|nr:hypothetical protein [Pontibacter aquaedesilientis]MBD1396738.1 hypothetical protein [Pontibacter aquaedesilientis]
MYISLYSAKQIKEIKESMLWLGLFMLSGGLAALLHDIAIRDETRWYWAGAAFIVLLTGVLLVALGTNRLHLKEAYFSITPASISYRLHHFSQHQMICWRQIAGIQVSERYVLFDLHGGRQVLLRLKAIHSNNVASQVAAGVQVAALEHRVTLNGVRFNAHTTTSAGF